MKRILVAIDSTDESKLVVTRAVELARATGAKVRLLRAVAIQPFPMPPGITGATLAAPPSLLIESAASGLRHVATEIPEELRDGTVVEPGGAADVICAVARAYDADVVVIGAHRYGVLERVLGTTAAKVVNRIDRPVLVVRPAGDEEAIRPEIDAVSTDAKADRTLPSFARTSEILRREHERLEKVFDALLAAYREGDWADVRREWDRFEPALRAHMSLEEERVFPSFRDIAPREAAALLAEHDELRERLATLGVGIDLHVVSHAFVAELVGRLRTHGAREELLLYPWVDVELDASDVSSLPRAKCA